MIELLEMIGAGLGLAKDVTDVKKAVDKEKAKKEMLDAAIDAVREIEEGSNKSSNDDENTTHFSLINNFKIEL